MRESASKGLGIFAKFNIPRGTRVISEPALLEVEREGSSNAKDIVQRFEQLASSQQELFLQLHGYACDSFKCAAEREMEQAWQDISELHRKVLSIYAANAFGNVYFLGSRINHSCLPNVNFAYNANLKEETFHAIRDIMVGEELTIMYINGTNRTKDQRKAELNRWGFICSCLACEDTPRGKQREEMRAQLFNLDQQLAMDAKFGTNKSHKKALQTVQKMAAIQKSEGLVHREIGVSYVVILIVWLLFSLTFSYHDAATYCLKLGNRKMLLLWAEKELEVDQYCIGEDHPDYVKEHDIVERLRAAAEGSEPIDKCVTDWFSLRSAETCILM